MPALKTIEKPIIVASKDEPPYDITGSGEPTIGKSPSTIDILVATYRKIAKEKPKQKSLEKKLLEIKPVRIILYIIIEYNINKSIEPTNPNSSENKVNIKSVCFSGKKSK